MPTVADAEPWTIISYGHTRSAAAGSSIATVAESPGSATVDRSLLVNAAGTVQASLYDGSNRNAISTETVTLGEPTFIAAVAAGATLGAFVKSTLTTVVSTTPGYTAYSTPELVIGYGVMTSSAQTSHWSAAYTLLIRGALSLAELLELEGDPLSIVEPPRGWEIVQVSAGGSTYPVTLSESTTTTDAATAAYIATASVAETITAADSLAAATTWVLSLTETATAAESITTAGTFAASITEAASAADALTSAVTWARALTEAASASDLAAAVIHAVAALTEAASAADSQTTGSIYAGSVTEPASVSDALTAAATLVALLTEVATTSDAATSAATWVRLLTEPATAVDSVAGAQGAAYTASVTEVLAAAELLVAVLAAQGVISAPPLGHGIGMSRRVTQTGRSRPTNLNSRTR